MHTCREIILHFDLLSCCHAVLFCEKSTKDCDLDIVRLEFIYYPLDSILFGLYVVQLLCDKGIQIRQKAIDQAT